MVLYGESEKDTRGYYSSYEDGENHLLGLLEDEGSYYVHQWILNDLSSDKNFCEETSPWWDEEKGEPLTWEQAKLKWVEDFGIELEDLGTPDEIS